MGSRITFILMIFLKTNTTNFLRSGFAFQCFALLQPAVVMCFLGQHCKKCGKITRKFKPFLSFAFDYGALLQKVEDECWNLFWSLTSCFWVVEIEKRSNVNIGKANDNGARIPGAENAWFSCPNFLKSPKRYQL